MQPLPGPRGAQHQVVGAGIQPRTHRPVDRQGQSPAPRQAEVVADTREDDQAIKQVISVSPSPGHMQREIDLGRREFVSCHSC